MTFVFKIIDKDNKVDRWLLVEVSQRNNNIVWALYGERGGLVYLAKPLEGGNGTRVKNITTLYKDNEKYATLKFDKQIDLLSKEDKGKFGQFEREVDLHYIQAQYYGKGIFENGKFKEISLNYINAKAA